MVSSSDAGSVVDTSSDLASVVGTVTISLLDSSVVGTTPVESSSDVSSPETLSPSETYSFLPALRSEEFSSSALPNSAITPMGIATIIIIALSINDKSFTDLLFIFNYLR